MSDNNIEINTDDTDLENPAIDGQVEESNEVLETTAEEEFDLFDYTQFADNKVKLQVNGEEVVVPLAEALAGYQRQADYTRKTQELSEQRRQYQFGAALQEALQNDPNGTIALLTDHYGLGQQAASEEEDLYADPVEKQFRQLEKRIQAFEQQKAMDELERKLESLQNRYGDDFDANEVVSKALAIGSTDLEAVYKQIAFDKIYDESSALRKASVQKNKEKEIVTRAKREAAVVSGASSAKTADVSAKPITSLRDAYEAAKRQVGG